MRSLSHAPESHVKSVEDGTGTRTKTSKSGPWALGAGVKGHSTHRVDSPHSSSSWRMVMPGGTSPSPARAATRGCAAVRITLATIAIATGRAEAASARLEGGPHLRHLAPRQKGRGGSREGARCERGDFLIGARWLSPRARSSAIRRGSPFWGEVARRARGVSSPHRSASRVPESSSARSFCGRCVPRPPRCRKRNGRMSFPARATRSEGAS